MAARPTPQEHMENPTVAVKFANVGIDEIISSLSARLRIGDARPTVA
jgi:hypothetical protein